MQAAKQADRAGAGLQFGLQAGEPGTGFGDLIVDGAVKPFQHLVAHLLVSSTGRACVDQKSTCCACAPPAATDSASAAPANVLNIFIMVFLPGYAPSCGVSFCLRCLSVACARHQRRPISRVSGAAGLLAMTVSSMSAISRAHWRIEASKVVRPGGA